MRCWATPFLLVQRFYGAELLFDLGDLPGAADSEVGDSEDLAALQAAFTRSRWAARTPIAVEVPFEMPIGDTVVRGRIDAVFADPDGGVTVVDWKTGEPPRGAEALRQAAIQLAVYRMAWAALTGCAESSVRTAFHYVRSAITVRPDELPEADELVALLADSDHPNIPERGYICLVRVWCAAIKPVTGFRGER